MNPESPKSTSERNGKRSPGLQVGQVQLPRKVQSGWAAMMENTQLQAGLRGMNLPKRRRSALRRSMRVDLLGWGEKEPGFGLAV
jgi:hypothetical protein